MGVESRWKSVAPNVAPVSSVDRDESLGHFEKSVDAVSFGFVATAILIAMFVVMAIFERFLRPRSAGSGGRNLGDFEAQMTADGKLNYPSPKRGVGVDARRKHSNLHCASCSCTVSFGGHLTTDASTEHSFQTDLKLSHKLENSETRKKDKRATKTRVIVNSCTGMMGLVTDIRSKVHHFRNAIV